MLTERRDTEELMDDPALPAFVYRTVLGDLAKVNRTTIAYRPTLQFLGTALAKRKEFKLLDVGFGQGDTLREIARWARRHRKRATLVGVDLNPNSAAVAREVTPHDLPITYITGDYADLMDGSWDVIASSLVAHHMSREQLLAFLRTMESEARAGWFVNDLHRSTLSYLGYPILAALAGWHRIVRLDGQTSIARAFRTDEWHELLESASVTGARVERKFPFRLCVSRVR
ncbi:methyltransferase domain-containing protein [Aurantiacibacter poecillastricola]|uniref:methyltransferase domain-containing protein n=1 Tax=Aurantiacibacter poecillastricola TaxID=3064385 RepID=UPI00273FC39E|nr:methyltransferase domain-containing protein [Aurantiacibacter sp. 219JJ12-13]MDP5261712.1 methyltransferase domain-containing protein [Aurantiacibacter sp. 219JJ12-13]